MLGVLVACGALELLLRLVGYENDILVRIDPDLGKIGRPNFRGIQSLEGRNEVAFNSVGYHDVEHSYAKPPGTFRVIVLGDSFSAGEQVTRESTYAYRLSAELARCPVLANRPVETVNLAIEGYNPYQMYLTQLDVAPKYSPDLILAALTPNPSLLAPGVPAAAFSPIVEFRDGQAVISRNFRRTSTYRIKSSKLYAGFVRLVDHSRLLQYAMEAVYRYRTARGSAAGLHTTDGSAATETAAMHDAWAATQQVLSAMGALARAHRTPIIFALTTPDEVDPERPPPRTAIERDRRYASIVEALGLPFLSIADGMQSYAVEHRVYLNGFGSFSRGNGHWTSRGHEVAATLYADGICNWLRSGRSPASPGATAALSSSTQR